MDLGKLRPLPANLLTLLVITLVCFAIWYFLRPAPPTAIVMSTGAAEGAYARYGQRYAEVLARNGIQVVLLPSAGAVENLERLAKGEVDVGFVQTGLATDAQRKQLVSLGSLYFEPLWVVHRGEEPIERLTQLKGKRIGIGSAGSGTRALALKLLGMNGVDANQASLVEDDARGMVEGLMRGELDAVFLVLAPDSPLFRELLGMRGIRLMNMVGALSYQRRLPEVTRVTLPAGVLDLERNIPPVPTETVAATATLVANANPHPAIQYLLVRAAKSIHGDPGILSDAQHFPTIANYQEFQVPEQVSLLYKEGPPLLYRHLPFWLANLIYRLWLAALAGFAIFIMFTDWIPKFFKWVINLRVGGKLIAARQLEKEIRAAGVSADLDDYTRRLKTLKKSTKKLKMPLLLALTKDELKTRLEEMQELLDECREAAATKEDDSAASPPAAAGAAAETGARATTTPAPPTRLSA
jgi:TRAP transporter TAXI family solute receptor